MIRRVSLVLFAAVAATVSLPMLSAPASADCIVIFKDEGYNDICFSVTPRVPSWSTLMGLLPIGTDE